VTGGGPSPASGLDDTRAFIEAMHAIARPLAPRMVAAVQPAGAKHLLDLGGASGTYTLAFLEAVPGLQATLFDLPEVIPLARERFATAGCLDRVGLVSGNYLTDPLPGGHDLAWLVRRDPFQTDRKRNLALYRRVFDSLLPGGRIVIRDHVMSEDHTAPRAGACSRSTCSAPPAAAGPYSYREIARSPSSKQALNASVCCREVKRWTVWWKPSSRTESRAATLPDLALSSIRRDRMIAVARFPPNDRSPPP